MLPSQGVPTGGSTSGANINQYWNSATQYSPSSMSPSQLLSPSLSPSLSPVPSPVPMPLPMPMPVPSPVPVPVPLPVNPEP